MTNKTIIAHLSDIGWVYSSRLACQALQLSNAKTLQKMKLWNQMQKGGSAIARIEKLQIELIKILAVLHVIEEGAASAQFMQDARAMLLSLNLPGEFKALTTDVNPVATPKNISAVSVLLQQYGSRPLELNFPAFDFSELQKNIDAVKATNLRDQTAIAQSIQLIGTNEDVFVNAFNEFKNYRPN